MPRITTVSCYVHSYPRIGAVTPVVIRRMDPLSITTSVIAIAALAGQIGSAFARLRALSKEMPGRLHALNNEVADIEVVLHQVAAVIEERTCLPVTDETTITQLLGQAKARLDELKEIVEHLITTCTEKGIVISANAWRKRQPRLQCLQEDIKTIKGSLNIIIGTSNSYVRLLI
jgi:hypothetical protein